MKKLLIVLMLLSICSQAYAFRVDAFRRYDENNQILNDYASGVTIDSVLITKAGQHQVLAKSTNVYSVTVSADVKNRGFVYLTTSTGLGERRITVSDGSVRINTDNLADIYVSGHTVGDRIGFIGELR